MSKQIEDLEISISALARLFKLDRGTVARRLEGLDPLREQRGAKLYRLGDVAPVLAREEEPEDDGGEGVGDMPDRALDRAKYKKLSAEAERLELRLKRERGESVTVGEVKDELLEIFKGIYRRVVVSYPLLGAQHLAAATDQKARVKILSDDLDEIFHELSHDYKTFLRDDPGGDPAPEA